MKCRVPILKGLVCCCCLSGSWLGHARAQLTAGSAHAVVSEATQVVDVWRRDQHLYVKGQIGVGREQLAELEQWLDQNGPNWTIVLMDDSVGERYRGIDGRSWGGFDAVEQAMGRGLSNRTPFGTLQDARTGESNGAVFVLSLGDRSFSYFASDAQDRRGLGESQWRGRLDRPAYEAMENGGRIVDAVKNTVRSINQSLDRAIATEEQARVNLERERERTRERIQMRVERARAGQQKVEGLRDAFVDQHPTAKGELARPPLGRWQQELDTIAGQLDASDLLPPLQRAGTLIDETEGYLLSYRKDTAFPSRWQALKASVDEAPIGPNDIARSTLDEARDVLAKAQRLRDNGDRTSIAQLDQTEVLLKRAEQEVKAEQARLQRVAARRRLLRRVMLAALAVLLLIGALLLTLLNRRRRPYRDKALERFADRKEQIRQTTDGLLGLLERTQMLIGKEEDLEKRGSHGRTLEVSRQTIDDVDNLFIMSRTVDAVLRQAEALIQPKSLPGRLRNLFGTQPFQQGIDLLDEQTLRFSPEDGIPLLPDEEEVKSAQLLGDVAKYKGFEMTFEGLVDQYKRRYERAVKSLDALDESWTSLAPTMDEIEARIDDLERWDEQQKAESAKDGYFELSSLSEQLIPAVQQAYDAAERTGVGDPLTAMQVTLARAQRQSQQAQQLASEITQFRAESLPVLRDNAQALANEGRQIDWVDDFLRQLSDRAEQLVQTMVAEDASQPLEEFFQQLKDLVHRARRCVELDQTTRDQATPQLAACEQTTAQARQELGSQLRLAPDQVLRETDADPDQLLSAARHQLVSAAASLDRGAFLPAEAATKEAEHLVDEANELIERTRDELRQQPSRRAQLAHEANSLSDEVERCQKLLMELKNEFAASAFSVMADESTETTPSSTSIDADLQLVGLLRSANRSIDASERLRQQAKILEAAAELDEAQSTLAEVTQLCQQVSDLATSLRQQQEANRQKLQDLAGHCARLEDEVVDQRTMTRTRDAYHACLAAHEDADRAVLARHGSADPVRAAALLDAVSQQLDEVQQSLTADRDAFAEAARSCEAARTQLQSAQSLVERAATDQLPDSSATRRAIAEIQALADQTDQLRLRLNVPHDDWPTIDQQADQLTLKAGEAAATLRGDLNRAQRCVRTLQQAAEQVRRAAGWTGVFGINIMGSPGGDDLEMARRAFSSGDYEGALRFAGNATALATRAVQEAEMRVRERRRAEQRRREQERRRRLSPVILPGAGGISMGSPRRHRSIGSRRSTGSISRPSGSGRSSGGSPGSGFQRSGW